MAWPFSNVIAPNIDSGFVTLTGSLVNVPNISAGTFWILGLWVTNDSGAEIIFAFTDAAGKSIYPLTPVAGGGYIGPVEFPFMPITGVPKWKGNGLQGKLWGYQ